jgi:spore maturation protein CgeB
MIEKSILFLTSDPFVPGRFRRPDLLMPPQLDCDVTYVQPLRRVFSQVVVHSLWTEYLMLGPHRANQRVLELAETTQPSYVLWPALMYEVFRSTLLGLRAAGACVVGWFFDDDVRFDDYTAGWLPCLDYCLTHQREALTRYGEAGARAYHLIAGANADVYMPLRLTQRYDVAFVGRNFGNRGAWLDGLASRGVPVDGFGHGFPSGFLPTPDVVRLFNESRINLCFSRDYRQNAGLQLKARVFEICMSGGFALCEWTPDLEEYFDIGREVEAFCTMDEAVEKIQFYLKHETRRISIARAGLQRAQACYREDLLLESVFESIEQDEHPMFRRRKPLDSFETSGRVFDNACASWHANLAQGLIANGAPRHRWVEEARLALSHAPTNREARSLLHLRPLPQSTTSRALGATKRLRRLRAFVGKIKRALCQYR